MVLSANFLKRFISVYQVFAYALVLILLPACGPEVFSDKAQDESKQISCEVDSVQRDRSGSSAINLFIDGTPSMEGYTAQPNSLYVRTLKQLDSILATGGNRPLSRDLAFYRLGQTASGDAFKQIDRNQYRDAQLSKFYGGSGYESLAVSHIDEAVLPPDEENELTIIVTDLYQANDDITSISSQIKKHHFSNESSNPAVGVVGLLSEFNGPVYVEELSGTREFSWAKEHPFYVIFIGQQNDVEYYISQLTAKLGSKEGQVNATIFSPELAYEFALELNTLENNQALKERLESQTLKGETVAKLLNSISVPAVSMKQGDVVAEVHQSPIQMIELLDGAKNAVSILADAAIEQTSPYTLGIDVESQKLLAQVSPYRFSGSEASIVESEDATLASAVSISDWKIENGLLSFSTEIDASKIQTPGIYLYKAAVTVDASAGGSPLQPLPDTWQSWDAPQGSSDGSRTINLLPFLEELKSLTEREIQNDPPVLGQLCYLIQKS